MAVNSGVRQTRKPSARQYHGVSENESLSAVMLFISGTANLKINPVRNGAGSRTSIIPSFVICLKPILNNLTVIMLFRPLPSAWRPGSVCSQAKEPAQTMR